ncbi:hypothetical protein BC833DRAFT_606716 [Globomyces pollinis-pini]|nr:hypothetical protein BC833DRAFT_606716 [Globomyces pollinis-pini]
MGSPVKHESRLEQLASLMTNRDISLYTLAVENHRRLANANIDKPIAIWHDWYEGIESRTTQDSLPSATDGSPRLQTDPFVRPPSRGRSIMSPIISPFPVPSTRSPSPGFVLDDDGMESDNSMSSNSFRFMSIPKANAGRLRKRLSITTSNTHSTRLNSPASLTPEDQSNTQNNIEASNATKVVRSHSDGDLSDYLKGFSELKRNLQTAQATCNQEIRRILDELQDHVQKSTQLQTAFDMENESVSSRRDSDDLSLIDYSSVIGLDYMELHPDPKVVPVNTFEDYIGNFQRRGSQLSKDGVKVLSPPKSKIASSKTAEPDVMLNRKLATKVPVNPLIPENLKPTPVPRISVDGSSPQKGSPLKISDGAKIAKNRIEMIKLLDSSKDVGKQKSDTTKITNDDNLEQEKMKTSHFMTSLLSVISIAQSVLDLSLTALMAPNTCQTIISRIQKLQSSWSMNPDWQLQELVVRLLIAFASVARLMEHFEEDLRTWAYMFSEQGHPKNVTQRRSSQFNTKFTTGSPLPFAKRSSMASNVESSDMADGEDSIYDSDSHESPQRKQHVNLTKLRHINHSKRLKRPSIADSQLENRWSFNSFRAAVDEEQNLNVLLEVARDGTITYASPAVKKVFQYSQNEVVGANPIPFLVEPNVLVTSANMALSQEKPSLEICFMAKRADGRLIKIEGKGIVNIDSQTRQIKSSVWITKPVKVSRADDSPLLLPMKQPAQLSLHSPLMLPAQLDSDEDSQPLPDLLNNELIPNVDMAFCNICERSVPAIHFSNHMTSCLKIHKTEMDLVLLNDEIKVIKASCEDQVGVINEEVSMIKQEADIGNIKQQFLKHLMKLADYGTKVLKVLDQMLAIRNPRQFDNRLVLKEEISQCEALFWDPTICVDFFPVVDENNSSETMDTVVDEGVIAIGVGLQNIGKSIQDLIDKKKLYMKRMQDDSFEYQDCLQLEQQLVLEIGVQTQALAQSNEKESNDSDFELKEVGGVFVKIPSIMNLKSEKPFTSNRKYSDGDSNGFDDASVQSSDSDLPAISRKFNKHKSLRIKTNNNNNDDAPLPRSTSLRNPRMVVGMDKSFEIETIVGSPIVASPLSNNFRRLSCMSGGGLSAAPLSHSSASSLIAGSTTSLSPAPLAPSIKDYEIIKPISKGAFGSVFLAKKKITGQYHAIKVLKKADMVAKNQVTNIKSERTILTQIDSPFVVKLFSTFQSRNHIYLVMEYLNGGDCAALIKSMGQLDEAWAKQYVTEMIQGLEFLHYRDIVHRDLKPDNMLIDSNGHVKLTDFGLSRVGFLGRRAIGVGDVAATPAKSLPPASPQISETGSNSSAFPFTNMHLGPLKNVLGRRESVASISSNDSFVFGSRIGDKLEERNSQKKLVGTPDYLAPESILGLGQGTSVDWWAAGVILYEFLYGIPPFNASTPSQVFENILMRKIDWFEDDVEISPEARILMEKLMCPDIETRLGAKGAGEVKAMSWFQGTDWNHLLDQKVYFVPTVKNIEDTDYFDTRGVQKGNLSDSDENDKKLVEVDSGNTSPNNTDNADFGEAVLKNLPLLERANQQIMTKIKSEFPEGEQWMQKRRDSLPVNYLGLHPNSEFTHSPLPGSTPLAATPIPIPNRTMSPNPNPTKFSANMWLSRRRESLPANAIALPSNPVTIPSTTNRKKSSPSVSSSLPTSIVIPSNFIEEDDSNNETPSVPPNVLKTRNDKFKDRSPLRNSQIYLNNAKQTLFSQQKSRESLTDGKPNDYSADLNENSFMFLVPNLERPLDVLIVDGNPVSAKIMETVLVNIGCRCIKVKNGAEALQCVMGDVHFDVIFTDIKMPIMNGLDMSRMIKTTSNVNSNTPIIAISSVDCKEQFYDYVLVKPVLRSSVLVALTTVNVLK